jgi:hypothetical protein
LQERTAARISRVAAWGMKSRLRGHASGRFRGRQSGLPRS